MFKKLEKTSPAFASFLSAVSISLYILLVSSILGNMERLFDSTKEIFAPIIMLTLLSASVLICGFLSLGFPFYLFWVKKQTPKAIKIVGFTGLWLIIFFAIYLGLVILA